MTATKIIFPPDYESRLKMLSAETLQQDVLITLLIKHETQFKSKLLGDMYQQESSNILVMLDEKISGISLKMDSLISQIELK